MNTLTQTSFKNPLLYLIILILGIGMRLFNLTDGLWLDEIWSMIASAPENTVSGIINTCKTDSHPPLFDIILHYFLVVFGNHDINSRLLALFIGLLGILTTFYYSLRISKSYFAAFLSFALITLSFFHIYYSNEGRFYTFLYLLSISVISEFYLFLRDKKIRHLILFVIFSVLLAYTHYYGAILIFALYIIVLFLWVVKEIDRKLFLQAALGGVIILLLFSPWIPFMFSGQQKESWMVNPGIGDFFDYLYKYTGKNPVEFLFVLLGLILSVKLWKTNVKLYALLYGTILLGFFIPFIVSYLSIPMLHFRYTFIYYPSIIFIVALFWEQTNLINDKKKIIVFSVVLASILVNFLFISPFTEGIHKDPWKEIGRDISKFNYSVNDNVYTEVDFYLNYYLEKNDHKKANQLPELIEDRSFWFLKSPYDAKINSIDSTYRVDKTQDYGEKFILLHYTQSAD